MNNNIFIHSSAGSGKTTRLVKEAIKIKDKKVIITTYTNKNVQEIRNKFFSENGCVPTNVRIISWLRFLLYNLCRPYQRIIYKDSRISSVFYKDNKSHKGPPKKNISKYYFCKKGWIYSDKIADFANECLEKTADVIKRLEGICNYLIIDEAQDLSGYDFCILDKIISDSNIKLIMAGDNRQNTFDTSPTSKNKKFSKDIRLWYKKKEKEGYGQIEDMNKCWRCNKEICQFADKIYQGPDYDETISENNKQTWHDGLFYVRKKDLQEYYEKYKPSILIYNKNAKKKDAFSDYPTINFGKSKGMTVDRVLIVPTNPIKEYLKGKDNLKRETKAKFYIAVTRAKYSVAFLIEDSEDFSHFSEIKEYKKYNS